MKDWIMKNWRNICKRLLFPDGILIFLLVIVSAMALIYSLGYRDVNQIVAYVSYAVSAYTLTVVVLRMPPIIRSIKEKLYANEYSNRCLTDAQLRARLSLYSGFAINVLYAVFKFCTGVYFHSVWLGAIAVYYIILSIMRLGLIRKERHRDKYESAAVERSTGIKSYRTCGKLMFLLNIAVTGFVVQMIWQNKSYSYPGFLIYASAAYAFFCMTTAIINMIKFRTMEKPVLSAAKMLSFAGALISMLALQTAMLTQFGQGQDGFIRLMNSISGGFVCIAIFVMAVYMVHKSNKEIKNMEVQNGQ